MKLAFRFLLATMLGISIVITVAAALEFRRELAVFDADLLSDHRVLARALVPAFTLTWAQEGRSGALQLLERVNVSEGALRARWLPKDSPDLPGPELLQSSDGLIQTTQSGAREPEIRTFARANVPDAPGYIEIHESTRARSRYVTESLLRSLLVGTGIFAWCAASGTVLGFVLVGRPVLALVEQARRIGAGQFETRSNVHRSDELGVLADEMNHMAELLEENRRKLDEESAGRLRAINQLRHADRLATAGKLASGIAHELGTPLNVVSGRAKLIRTNPVILEDARHSAQIIENQVVRMTGIIRQLLDFARAGESRREPLRARELVLRVRVLLTTLAESRGARLELGSPLDDVAITGDGEQLVQVLSNVIVNAVQAMMEGGVVTLSVTTRRLSPPGGKEPEDYAVIEVTDTGPGMSTQVQARVFEPFFTTKGVGEGTGLGLSVAYGIVQEHGGFLAVESSPGQGSRFSICLPVASECEGGEGRAGAPIGKRAA